MNKAAYSKNNMDPDVVEDFGKEWEAFNQTGITEANLQSAFDQYFHIFPFHLINQQSVGFDMGCGSGRWAQLIAPKVGKLNCIDPSSLALEQAKDKLSRFASCEFECASVSETTLANGSQDFGYCLGVLHHIPDTQAGLKSCTDKLKPGAPFLLYLYYRFDNKPIWFKCIWKLSDFIRRGVSKLPFRLKLLVSQAIALFVYLPLSKLSLILEKAGLDVSHIPLSDYRNKSFYFLRTDALDRFGTKLEKRFTRQEIQTMMEDAGMVKIKFSDRAPFWVATGIKGT